MTQPNDALMETTFQRDPRESGKHLRTHITAVFYRLCPQVKPS